MSDPKSDPDSNPNGESVRSELEPVSAEPDLEDAPSSGPNLTLIYCLIALAMAIAIGCALTIVMPFYHRSR